MGRVAFIAGATGATGRCLVRRLLGDPQYSRIIAGVRRPELMAANFPGLPSGLDRRKLKICAQPLDSSFDPEALGGAVVVLSALGTSRANVEVQVAMATDPDEGFNRWLCEVDVAMNARLAEVAAEAGAAVFGRVSARGADAAGGHGGTGSSSTTHRHTLYHKHQGLADEAVLAQAFPAGCIVLRPGRLDRGEALRQARPWELAHHTAQGPGLSVDRVAARLLQEVDAALQRWCGSGVIVEHDDIVSGE